MVKPKSPRILAAAAVAALALGLSSCATPQTLIPYTPAAGVNLEAPRAGAPADSTEVPLKVLNLLIISTGESTGIISAAILSPAARSDELVSIEGQPLDADGQPRGNFQPIQANIELPAGEMVVLTDGHKLEVTGAPVQAGLGAKLKLTFKESQEQLIDVPIVDGNNSDYRSITTPTPAASATPTEPNQPAEAEPTQPLAEPTQPAAEPTQPTAEPT